MRSVQSRPRFRREPNPAGGRAAVLSLAGLLAGLTLGCAGDGLMRLPSILGGQVDESGNAIESVAPVTFGEWRKDSLDCPDGECQNVYGVIAPRGGALRAQVFAPYGTTDAPDFELVLLDRNGEPIARPLEPYGRPRTLDAQIDPGSYFLRVAPRGKNQGPIRYEIVAEFTPKKPKKASASASSPVAASSSKQTRPPTSTRTPTPSPTKATPVVQEVANRPKTKSAFAGRTPLVSAEVLDVEERDGVPAFVLLDAGTASVSLGMHGRLMEDGEEIGEFVIIEVLPDGSRAKLSAPPTGEFSIDTVADIFE